MASTIQIKRGTGSAVPSGLADGELAINLDNGQLYFGSGSTSVNDFTFNNITVNQLTSSIVTSSIIFSSGSNIFGDALDDTHTFTGHITSSGNISASGNIYANRFGNNLEIIDNSNTTTIAVDSAAGTGNSALKINVDGVDRIIFQKDALPTTFNGNTLFSSPITASGDISASGNIYTQNVKVLEKQGLSYHAGTDSIRVGSSDHKTEIQGENITLAAPVTASGNISASGTIIGSNLTNVENTAISTFAGTSNITTVGTIGTGTWQGTAIADAYLSSNTAHLTGTQTFSGAKTFSANPILSGTTKLVADDMEAIHYDGQLVISQDNRKTKLRGTSFNVDTNITASGNISSSDYIYADRYYSNGQIALNNINGAITVGYDNTYPITIGKSANPITLLGQVTASGNISSSGTIFTDEISSPSNNLTISSSTVKITSTTDGEANLILESDSDNNDENDNPFMLFTQDGGAIEGQIGLSGDADKWPDGTTLTGVTGNAMVIGMQGGATSTNRQLYLAAGNTASLRIANDADIHIYENLNVTKTISVANTSVVDYGITNADTLTFGRSNRDSIFTGTSFTVQTNVTASGNISSSGDIYASEYYTDGYSSLNTSGTQGRVFSAAGITGIQIGRNGSSNKNIELLGPVTASGDISATGTILAGWHNSPTRIKILVSDFIPDDIGRPAMIDDTGSDRWLESHGTGKLFASLPIPTGFKATHVHIYGSGTSALEVSEMNVNSKSVTSKGTGNIGTELDITDVTSSTTNYLLLELAQASGEEVYGGYITIEAV